jgi:flavin reductase (DIM6/NTAB) family NADH-FMN oxidoreductase RutF
MRVHAQVVQVHVAGDHDVVLGRVLELETDPADERPMLFFRGRFGVEDAESVIAPNLWGWGDHWG